MKKKVTVNSGLIVILGLIFVLAINLYLRSFPINFPQLKTQAKNNISQKINQLAIAEIDRGFPDFSRLAKEQLVSAYVSDYKKKNIKLIREDIQKEYLKLKSIYQDENGQTYMMELDGWHWKRYVENVLFLGHPGDRIIDGKHYDTFMLAPIGTAIGRTNFFYYLCASLYLDFSFYKYIPLSTFLFYLPLFFVAIFLSLLYFFCFRRWGVLAAIISCLFVGLSPIFLARSCSGWFDTDILNLLFPLLITWTYLKATEELSFEPKAAWLALTGFWVGLFSASWINWWFIFLVILLYEGYSLLNLLLIKLQYKKKNSLFFKQHLFSLSLFIAFSILWIILFCGLEPLAGLFSQLKGAVILNKSVTALIWPNTFSTVSELRKGNILQIANASGNIFLFTAALCCLLILFLRTLRTRKFLTFEYELIIILIVWFVSMYFACFRGIRFTMYLLIPLGISLGWAFKDAYENVNKKTKIMHKKILLLIIFVFFIVQMIGYAYASAKRLFPLMNDTWYGVLSKIKENTLPRSIVNSWWDYGDWFESVGNRPVIFDGQSQNTPQAYWMGKVLMNKNEEEAVGILRMLNNGANSAFETINSKVKNSIEAILLLEKVINLEPDKAREVLAKVLPAPSVDEVIRLVFSKPRSAYFIVESSMLDKISAISYLGNWDFLKVYIAQNLYKKDKQAILASLANLGLDSMKAQALFREASLIPKADLDTWVSKPVSFHSRLSSGRKEKNVIIFDNGLAYYPKEDSTYLYYLGEAKFKIPKGLFLFEGEKLREISYANSDLDISALMMNNKDGYRAILMAPELGNSLFARLYFLNGFGLKHFKPLIEAKDASGYIRVFEIIW